jgi:hypothetical protein
VGALFDAYLVVDWSARSMPSPERPTPDSIWIGERAGGVAQEANPRTRRAARAHLELRIAFHLAARRRVFVGFDFALGYPSGFARSLGIAGADRPWRAAWNELERLVDDGADNANNRFTVAAELNARCGGAVPGPFWGCPPVRRCETLASVSPGYPYAARTGELARLRWTDQGGVQPVWKLYGNGSVGSQTLLGIPVVAHLRRRFDDQARVWPFETGFGAVTSPVVYAEIWPTLAKAAYDPAVEVKDQRQVRATAAWLSEMDDGDALGALFQRPPGLPGAGVTAAVDEEGWILGVTTAPKRT